MRHARIMHEIFLRGDYTRRDKFILSINDRSPHKKQEHRSVVDERVKPRLGG
jgi:hypothetical protein